MTAATTPGNRRTSGALAAAAVVFGALLTPLVPAGGLAAPVIAQTGKAAPPAPPAGKTAPSTPAIENGSTVQIEYTLKNGAGAVIDSNRGGDPLTYVHGNRQIVPGLEHALRGMRVGEERSVTVAPEDAYGASDPKAVVEVPKQTIPSDALVPGTWLTARRPDGASTLVRVKEVREQTVVLDFNHPLAGQTLHFDIKILGVAPPAKP
jgi:FKBP-type peptidyl-prolyl cis-trans isomerase SlyD